MSTNLSFSYKGLPNDLTKRLRGYKSRIEILVKTTLESAVEIGQILTEVKDLLEYGQFQAWVDTQFAGNITHDSANNFMNLYKTYTEYGESHQKGIKNLSLSSLYKISRRNVTPELKEALLEAAAEDPPTREEVHTIISAYKSLKLSQAGVPEQSSLLLLETDVAENPKELKALSRLSEKKKVQVAELIGEGTVSSVKSALQLIRDKSTEPTVPTVRVEYSQMAVSKSHSLKDLKPESISLALVEAPLRANYLAELPQLCLEIDHVLRPGGYAIITVGHKAAMFCGPALEPLQPIHMLAMRRTPGKTRTILGTNLGSSSVLMAFAYKPPYRAPKRILIDLQTVGDEIMPTTDTEAIESFDEIHTGIEGSIRHFLGSLLETGDSFLHCIASANHFELGESLVQSAQQLGVSEYFDVHRNLKLT